MAGFDDLGSLRSTRQYPNRCHDGWRCNCYDRSIPESRWNFHCYSSAEQTGAKLRFWAGCMRYLQTRKESGH